MRKKRKKRILFNSTTAVQFIFPKEWWKKVILVRLGKSNMNEKNIDRLLEIDKYSNS